MSESVPASTSGMSGVSMRTAGVVAWLLGVVLTAVGSFLDLTDKQSGSADKDDVVVWLVMMAILAAITYAIYVFWYGRASAPDNAALIGGILAAITFVVFWTGLPSVFGVGALLLGLRGATAKAKVGAGLATLAILSAVVLAVVG